MAWKLSEAAKEQINYPTGPKPGQSNKDFINEIFDRQAETSVSIEQAKKDWEQLEQQAKAKAAAEAAAKAAAKAAAAVSEQKKIENVLKKRALKKQAVSAAAASDYASKKATEAARKEKEARRAAEVAELNKNSSNVGLTSSEIWANYPTGGEILQTEAAAASSSAYANEQAQILPEVVVKSDFSKYLFFGGLALGLYYILRGKK